MRDIRQHRVAQSAGRFDLGLIAQHLNLLLVGERRAGDHHAAPAAIAQY
jgi:hypothetical protein